MGDIKVEGVKVLAGPNIWASFPVLEILTDIGPYEERPSDTLPGFTDRLVEALPGLWEHRCSECRRGGLLERMRRGTYMGHIIEHIALEIQSQAGMETGFGRTRGTGRDGVYHIVIEYKDPQAAKACAMLAIDLAETLAQGRPLGFNLQEEIAAIREQARETMFGPSTQAIVDAARKRGIPYFRLDDGALVQLGHGRYARRIQATQTSFTSSVAANIASDKVLTKKLLSNVGVPVPRGEVVSDPDSAWQTAQWLGGPVVVKPYDGNQGKAVSTNLTTESEVRRAFDMARTISPQVIVEEYIPGSDYRLLVIDGKLVAAAQRRPAQVVADGLRTIRRLVEVINADPQRGNDHGAALTRIKMDAAAELTLARQDLTWESVPEAGRVVLLRDNSNLSTGGTAVDVTGEVHPDNARIAVLAARVVGLDVAGIDLVCEDISRPLHKQGGIVEVNAAPGLRMHLYPSEGKARPVGEAIVDMLFPHVAPSRVPLIAVTGTNGKTTVTRMIGHVYSTMKKFVGMTSTDGIYFDGVRHEKGDCSGPRSAEAVLQHPEVEVAVLETARGGILRSGLGWDRSTVSVVLNVTGDHLGLGGVDTLEQLARVKRVVVEAVARDGYGVLNADDPLVAYMARDCPGDVIFFGMDPSSPVITEHLASGGKVAYLRGGSLVLAEGTTEKVLMKAARIPATHKGLIPFQVQNALAAAAACWGAGVPFESIRLGLRTFQADDKNAPGRFNLFEVGGCRVIVDYGHNPAAMRALKSAVEMLRPRRTIALITAPGDRRDSDLREYAAVAAEAFDWIIVREDEDLRGRRPGEMGRILTEAIAAANPSLPFTFIADEYEATEQALDMAREGDLVVLIATHVDDTIEQVKRRAERAAHAPPGNGGSHLHPTPLDHNGSTTHDIHNNTYALYPQNSLR